TRCARFARGRARVRRESIADPDRSLATAARQPPITVSPSRRRLPPPRIPQLSWSPARRSWTRRVDRDPRSGVCSPRGGLEFPAGRLFLQHRCSLTVVTYHVLFAFPRRL